MSTSSEDRLVQLVRQVVCSPSSLIGNRAGEQADLADRVQKQITLARSLGRVALRAAAASRPAEQAAPPTLDHDEGEIQGYDGLSARDVIAIVRVAEPSTLAWILRREQQGKQRVTILRAIEAKRDRQA